MNNLDPVSVALKFGFVAVLYLFLLWVARSARRDLGRSPGQGGVAAPARPSPIRMPPACTRPPRSARWTSPNGLPGWSSSGRPDTSQE